MSMYQVSYGNSIIEYSVTFADRKTLGIKVHPDKSVHIVAPTDTTLDQIKKKVHSKAAWIIKQQDFFLSFHPLTPARKYISGETHLYLGKQYRLKVIQGSVESVKLHGGNITVYTRDTENKQRIEKQLKAWYKSRADQHFHKLFLKLIPLSQPYFKGTPTLHYKWMEKRWGSCSKNGQISLNLELIKAPKRCIEYVITHEICHLAHLNHSSAFYELLDELLPGWRQIKEELEILMV